MSNEATIIPKPLAVPSGVSTCYVRQNVISEAIHNGIDRTAPYGSTTSAVILPIGGPVDVNGVLYSIASEVSFVGLSADTDYYIYLDGSGDNLTPTIGTDAGTFDASKNARYLAGGERVLNWVCRGNGVDNVVCSRLVNPQEETWVADQDLRESAEPVFAGMEVDGNDLSQSGSPTFAGMEIDGNQQNDGNLTLSTGNRFIGRHYTGAINGSYTQDEIFDILSPLIPNVGDSMCISGGTANDSGDGAIYVFSHAHRHSSVIIHLYKVGLSSVANSGYLLATEGNSGSYDHISIAW